MSFIDSQRDAARELYLNRIEIVAIMLQSKLRQIILEYTDYFLSLVEKCMEWSLPEQNIEGANQLYFFIILTINDEKYAFFSTTELNLYFR